MIRAVLRFLPAPFWCYLLPMLASSLGWLPKESPVYSFASRQILPVCLVLMLLGTDLRSLTRLGPAALRALLAGAAGTLLGGLAAFALYRPWLPAGSWGAVGALTGSWIGGSANLLAVKEALAVPDSLIGPVILVDALVAYGWMALLIAASAWKERWDRLIARPLGTGPSSQDGPAAPPCRPGLRSRPRSSGPGNHSRTPWPLGLERPVHLGPVPRGLQVIFFAVVVSLLAQAAASRLPALPGLSSAGWTVLLVTSVTLGLSATRLRTWGGEPASPWGKWLLYVLLITIGARASIQAILAAPVFLALGLTWITLHGILLLAAGWIWKTPLGLLATASQANIGGVVSAPLVGATYSRELAGIGLLMAVLGNIVGTYAGILAGSLARTL